MYRPNRIGPMPLADIEQVPFVQTGAKLNGAESILSVATMVVADAVAPEDASARSWVMTDTWTLSAARGVCVGVKVSGSELFLGGEYIFSFGGSIMFTTGAETECVAMPMIGRVDTDGLDVATMNQWALMPSVPSMPKAFDVGIVSAAMNGSVLYGDFGGAGASLTKELFAGFWLMNHAGNATIADLKMSVSAHRFTKDLDAYDSSR